MLKMMNYRRQLITSKRKVGDVYKTFEKRTKTSAFLLPIMAYGNKIINSPHFIDSYIYDLKQPSIVCVFENIDEGEDNSSLLAILEDTIADSCYITSWDEGDEIIVEFRIPNKYRIDFQFFLEGKYSKLSSELKEILLSDKDKIDPPGYKVNMFSVLNPTDEKRKQMALDLGVDFKSMTVDIYDPPDIQNEKFITLEDLRKKYGTNKTV